MGVIEAIKKGFGIAAKGMGLVAVLFVFNLLGNLATLPFAPAAGTTPTPQATVSLLAIGFIFIIASIFVQGGSLGLVKDVIKEGKMKLSAMGQYGVKYFGRLLVLGIVILLLVVVVALVAGILIALTVPLKNTAVTVAAVSLAAAIIVVTALYFFIPFILSPYAVVCDGIGAIDALKKGIEAGRKPFIKVFKLLALAVVLVLITLGVGFLIGLVIGLISVMLPAGVAKILMLVVSSAMNSYLGVVATAAFMTYYLTKKEDEVVLVK